MLISDLFSFLLSIQLHGQPCLCFWQCVWEQPDELWDWFPTLPALQLQVPFSDSGYYRPYPWISGQSFPHWLRRYRCCSRGQQWSGNWVHSLRSAKQFQSGWGMHYCRTDGHLMKEISLFLAGAQLCAMWKIADNSWWFFVYPRYWHCRFTVIKYGQIQ